MKTITTLLFFLFTFVKNSSGQSKEDEARILYSKAEETYSMINKVKVINPKYYYMTAKKKDYDDVLNSLSEAQKRIGTKPKLIYLFIKAIYDASNEGVYPQTKEQYNLILQYIDSLKIDANYPKEKAKEIINIKLDVEKKLKDPKIINPRFNSVESAINFIRETIIKNVRVSIKILDVSYDLNNIFILGVNSGSVWADSRFLYVLDINSLQKDEQTVENINRINNHFVFANNNQSFYLLYIDLKSKFLQIKTAKEFFLKVAGKQVAYDKGVDIDIFLNCKSYSFFGSFDLKDEKDNIFHSETEADYVEAWKYLYSISKN